MGMYDGDEPYEDPHRPPVQIHDPIVYNGIVFSVDGAHGRLHGVGIVEEGSEFDLLSVLARRPSTLGPWWCGREVGHGIASDEGNQMILAGSEQLIHRGSARIVGVGDKVAGLLNTKASQQSHDLFG